MSTDTRNRSNSFDPDNGWSTDIENVCEAIRSNAVVMSQKHAKLYSYYAGQLKYYKIPVIIISGLNSVIAVGLQPYLDQGIISGSNCLLALLCGIIGSIELFLGIQTSMETENAASKNFYLLSVNIFKALSLERHRRSHSGKEYLEEVYTEYSKLYENSALISGGKHADKLSGVPMLVNGKLINMEDEMMSGSDSPPPVQSSKSLLNIFGSKKPRSTTPTPRTPPRTRPSPMISGDEILRRGRKDMFSPEDAMERGRILMGGGGMMSDMAPVQQAMNQAVSFAAQGAAAQNLVHEVASDFRQQLVNTGKEQVNNAKQEIANTVERELTEINKEVESNVSTIRDNAVDTISTIADGVSQVSEIVETSMPETEKRQPIIAKNNKKK
jgi:hypothetical protein